MTVLYDFIRGVYFLLYVLIKIDNFLFKLFILCMIPVFCIIEDIRKATRYAFMKFLYKRTLYILSCGKFGNDYFVNKCITGFRHVSRFKEGFYVFRPLLLRRADVRLGVQLQRRNNKIKEYYAWLKDYKNTIAPTYGVFIPLLCVRMFLVPIVNVYLWFVVSDVALRVTLRQKSFYYRSFFHALELYEFKDHDMHPTFKKVWPLHPWWFLDALVEIEDFDFSLIAYEDEIFIQFIAFRRRLRLWVLDKLIPFLLNRRFLEYVSYFMLGCFLIIYNTFSFIYSLLYFSIFSIFFLFNSVVYGIFAVRYGYYVLWVNLLRWSAGEPVKLFLLYLLNSIIFAFFILELVYWNGPFVARMVLFFYNPLALFATFMCVATLVPLFILKLVSTAWEEAWEELWPLIFTMSWAVPMGYAVLFYEYEPYLFDYQPEDLEAGHYEFFRKLFWDAFVDILKYVYSGEGD